MIIDEWDNALEYYITVNSYVSPSQHLLSLYPSIFWVSSIDQMEQISSSVKSLLIQGRVGRKEKIFNLSNLSSLTTLEMGCGAFKKCHSIVFESENDEWMMNQIFLYLHPLFLDHVFLKVIGICTICILVIRTHW